MSLGLYVSPLVYFRSPVKSVKMHVSLVLSIELYQEDLYQRINWWSANIIWLVVSNIFFHNIWDNPSHWLIFFKMVKTTNQSWWASKLDQWNFQSRFRAALSTPDLFFLAGIFKPWEWHIRRDLSTFQVDPNPWWPFKTHSATGYIRWRTPL